MLYICIHKKVCEYGLTAMSLLPNLFVLSLQQLWRI